MLKIVSTLLLILFTTCIGTLQAQTEHILFAWGINYNGQLGDGTTINKNAPVQVGTAYNWTSISPGLVHSLAVKRDGTLWAWGANYYGHLGDGTTTDKTVPVQIGSASNWVYISAGYNHSLAVKSDGTLWAWGYNIYGQLGDGTTTDRITPVQIGSANNWASVAAGGTHSLAVKNDGTLWAWGYNSQGWLGDGTTTDRITPVQIGSANNWASIAAGGTHSLAVKSDGTLWTWGHNISGQLGDGTTTDRITPVQIGSATNWTSISGGNNHSLAINNDGTIWAWGDNYYGQLGDGTTTDKTVPVQIGSASNWAYISAGYIHNVAVKSDGTLWAWGHNRYGQLGDGTTTDRITPVQIGSATNWAAVAAGSGFSLGQSSIPSNNAGLSALKISPGTLSPVFASGTFSYSATVDNMVSSVTVTPTVADVKATLTVNGTTVANGDATPPIALKTGSNTISVVVTAEDGTSTQTYTIDVNRLENTAPVLEAIGAKTVDELTTLSFTATANDSDTPANSLSYSLAGAPTGAAITTAGVFSWTPTEEQGPANYTFTVKVADNGSPALSDEEEITVTVYEANQAPVFASTPVTSAREGEEYVYQLMATDPDLPTNTLTLEAVEIPAWLSFDAATQTLSGTPDKTAEVSRIIRLQVSDGQEIRMQEFTLEVEITTGLFDKEKQEYMLVYPNPAKGRLIIELGNVVAEEKVTISLLSPEGRLLIQKHGSLQSGTESISAYLQEAQTGAYLLQVKDKESIRSIKVIKE